MEHINTDNKSLNILAIDGGGIRGVVPAHILNCMKTRLNVDLLNSFQMIAGTSTGAIIAAAVACKIEISRVVDLYKNLGDKIFSPTCSILPGKVKPGFKSLYESSKLEKVLKDIFGNTKLGDISTPLLIPSTDIGNGGVHVFKSNYSTHFTRDNNVLVRDAVIASCSAPTFFDPVKVEEYALADGGLWANNPSLCAFVDAQKRLKYKPDQIRILSLGTGHSKIFYGTNLDGNWGLINGWKGKEFINFILSLQSQSTHNYLQLIMNSDSLLRLNFESDTSLPLDDCNAINDLLSKADMLFTHKTESIKKFMNIN